MWLHDKIDQTECLKSFYDFSKNRCREDGHLPIAVSDFLALLSFLLDLDFLVVIVEKVVAIIFQRFDHVFAAILNTVHKYPICAFIPKFQE